MKYIYYFLFMICFWSCKKTEKEKITNLLSEWEGKEIIFPGNIVFSLLGKDMSDYVIPDTKYKIVTYIDSNECVSSKLQLNKWKEFINYTDSATNQAACFLFFFYSKDKRKIQHILEKNNFDIPVCIDQENKLSRLNKLPNKEAFHTFLLDKDNHIIAIGSPIDNSKIKSSYMQMIKEGKPNRIRPGFTYAKADKSEHDFGSISQKEVKTVVFSLKNTGKTPLTLYDIRTSCGCTSINYEKKPVQNGQEVKMEVKIKPRSKGYFHETITVHCNVESSPIQFYIKGDAL